MSGIERIPTTSILPIVSAGENFLSLESLPPEVLNVVMNFVDAPTVVSLTLTNRRISPLARYYLNEIKPFELAKKRVANQCDFLNYATKQLEAFPEISPENELMLQGFRSLLQEAKCSDTRSKLYNFEKRIFEQFRTIHGSGMRTTFNRIISDDVPETIESLNSVIFLAQVYTILDKGKFWDYFPQFLDLFFYGHDRNGFPISLIPTAVLPDRYTPTNDSLCKIREFIEEILRKIPENLSFNPLEIIIPKLIKYIGFNNDLKAEYLEVALELDPSKADEVAFEFLKIGYMKRAYKIFEEKGNKKECFKNYIKFLWFQCTNKENKIQLQQIQYMQEIPPEDRDFCYLGVAKDALSIYNKDFFLNELFNGILTYLDQVSDEMAKSQILSEIAWGQSKMGRYLDRVIPILKIQANTVLKNLLEIYNLIFPSVPPKPNQEDDDDGPPDYHIG